MDGEPVVHPWRVRMPAWWKDWDDREWFPNAPAQVAAVLCAGVFGLIGVSGLFAGTTGGERIWAAVLLVSGIVGVGRSLVAPSLEVNSRNLVLRTVFRTRRLAWSDVAHITIEEGRTGLNSGQREYLAVQTNDRTTWRHKELNAPSGQRHRSPCRVHDALGASNRELQRQRSIQGS